MRAEPNAAELVQVDALGATGAYRARTRETISDVAGSPVAQISLVPDAFVARSLSALRRAVTLPAERRVEALRRAGELFRSATLLGLDVEEYQHLVSRVSGLGLSVVRAAIEKVADRCENAWENAQLARPTVAVADWRDPAAQEGAALWARRGDVFGVHVAGNHPSVHAAWIEALALGYRVAVRPSRKEPFTPARLVAALREAGFGDDQIVLLPTDHAVADTMLRLADLSMVYGGDTVMQKYAADPDVYPQGPGRSKILIAADADWRSYVDLVADSASRSGGAGCTNTTAVLIEGDARGFAEALAEKLAMLPSARPEQEHAILPVQPVESARAVEEFLRRVAADAEPIGESAGSLVDELGDGSAALRPAVHLLPSAGSPQARVELGFPCVWVAPWTREDGADALRDTLVLTVITRDGELIDAIVSEPSIRNVYVGARPTYWSAPQVPHDGFLGDFLMESRGVVRSA
ncbi:aldehyde dehydrogenase family protein [Compostimonas suwonensis]|uniref:Acyl-CoA reductase-like NAD-dependent aldehyde dehydrogenase n=1 Tax=Compostimonas suwonensis TaxID=1048394 RepID=A0A2M9BB96_9MICO|nr:aldehyde dehydrogenase family protein [Compostimonas suwonensis]PJJ55218.1 acyl-CoA reductase-like NAD-dependent aldehyde dehydrogenase [Compostimonas suwonensis]